MGTGVTTPRASRRRVLSLAHPVLPRNRFEMGGGTARTAISGVHRKASAGRTINIVYRRLRAKLYARLPPPRVRAQAAAVCRRGGENNMAAAGHHLRGFFIPFLAAFAAPRSLRYRGPPSAPLLSLSSLFLPLSAGWPPPSSPVGAVSIAQVDGPITRYR